MYVHKSVWFENKAYTQKLVKGNDETAQFLIGGQVEEEEDFSGTDPFTKVR